jgi:hypothetical protein
MIALWYRNGELEPAPWQDGRRTALWHEVAPVRLDDPSAFATDRATATAHAYRSHRLQKSEAVFHPWTRRKRRRLARRYSTPGRRSALRISCGITEYRTIAEALLYLPDGDSVEQRHCDDVERWLAARGMA